MKRLIIAMAVCAMALPGCTQLSGVATNGTATAVNDQVVLKSTTALSLGELGFTSAEQVATAAIKSGTLSKADDAKLGTLVHTARGYRDQARTAVAAGQDASALLANLTNSLVQINALATPAAPAQSQGTDMADVTTIIADILSGVSQIAGLYTEISGNIAQAKAVLASNPDATMAQQLADAQAKLKDIQAQAAQADADFDAALAASQAG